MIKEVIVVEGVNDTKRLIEVFKDVDTIITNGSEISLETLNLIKKADELRGVIIFTDPDYPGERIRKKVTDYVPNAKQAFIRKRDGISKNHKKVGIEHASKEVIIAALENMLTPANYSSDVTYADLFKFKLIGSNNSTKLREYVSNELKIGHTNGKTFLKRLNIFGIDYKTLEGIINNYENR